MKRKYLALLIIMLLIDFCIIPSITSEFDNSKNIITVDDEPGDADFTSIKDAVNYSSPGDIIEVYSGIYPEEEIRIEKENITLLGISQELGGGDDTGKPNIKGDGTTYVIKLIASNVTVSNFIIENSWSNISIYCSCIRVGTYWPDELYNITISNCIISDCIIRNSSSGILVTHMGITYNTTIINNQIVNCNRYGIYVELVYNPEVYSIIGSCILSENIITDCRDIGVYLRGDLQNISGNRIKRCGYGIYLYGDKNIIYGNDFDGCSAGVYDGDISSHRNSIIKNNFKNYSRGVSWWFKFPSFISKILNLFSKGGWRENYWDTWIVVGPKLIPGRVVMGEDIRIPWFKFDWNPASEPYKI